MSNSEKVGTIFLVLQTIIRHMDVKSLKTARLVNKLWQEISRLELLSRNSVWIKINAVTFGKILKFLQHSENLPTTEFYFTAENLELAHLEEFVSCSFHHVKTLTIRFDSIDPFLSYSKLDNLLVLIRGCVFVEEIFLDPYFKWYESKQGEGENGILVNNVEKKKKQKNTNKNKNKKKIELTEDMIKLPHLKQLTFLVNFDRQNDLAMTRNSIGFKLLMSNLDTLVIVENIWLRSGGGGAFANNNNNNNNNNQNNDKNKNMDKLMREFWTQPKILELFKSFHFNRKLIRLSDLQNFADAQPKLELISLFDFQDKQTTAGIKNELYRIFQSSKNSLEILETASFFRLPDPNLPQLNTLTTLILFIDSTQNLEHYFPDVHIQNVWTHRLDSLGDKFPQLKTVRLLLNLEWTGKLSENWTRYFNSSSSSSNSQVTSSNNNYCFDSVENLELTGNPFSTNKNNNKNDWGINMNCGWWERLHFLFPQLKRITIKNTTQICLILPRIFTLWPELKSLRIWIPLGRATENHVFYFLGGDRTKYLQLDSVFTGLSHEVVKKQRELFSTSSSLVTQDNILSIEQVSQMRNSSSLCNLIGLQKLDCIFVGNYSEIGLLSWKCPLSIVSCLYAFSLLPDLNVRICYDRNHVNSQELRRNLESMSSFGVKFGDIPTY